MDFSRTKFLITGFILIFGVYTANRFSHIIGSDKIEGTYVFDIEEERPEGKVVVPIIEYQIKDSVYQFRAQEGTSYETGQKVNILLQGKDHDQPLLYTVGSFWIFPLVYFILPIILWTAFALSYLGKNEGLQISFRKPFFKKVKKRKNIDSLL
jgi:hypothetical protein